MSETTVDFISPVQITVDDSQVSVGAGGQYVVDMTAGADGALVAANNLSDLDSAADARTNLGATTLGEDLFTVADASTARSLLEVTLATLSASCAVAVTTAGALYLAVPTGITGTVSKIRAVTNGDPGGNVVFASAIGPSGGPFVAITNGGFTVANGATAGTASVATPTAANSVTGGTSIVRVSWDNGAATAAVVGVVIEITRA
jgi:hypothetical protein